MSRMLRSCLKLSVLWFLFLSTEAHSGQILPPRNLSLVWKDDFNPELSWKPPQQAGCKYDVQSETKNGNDIVKYCRDSSPWTSFKVMEGGSLRLTVKTVCNGSESEAAVLSCVYPDILKKLRCYAISSKRSECSWEAVYPGLSFFYGLVREDFSSSVLDNSSLRLQECPSYIHDGDIRTGCVLEATINHSIHILFNATVNGTLSRNTFTKSLISKVKLPPLTWTVIKVGNKLNISWIPPDIDWPWKYSIFYTECNKSKQVKYVSETSHELVLVPHCNYSIQIQAQYDDHRTPLSDIKNFAADADPNAVVWAAIIIPLVFAGLAILTFVCCRKNKDYIFPEVPQPRDFLSDIYDNNNKSTIRDLYIPVEEEENCKITMVMDPQNEYKPDC